MKTPNGARNSSRKSNKSRHPARPAASQGEKGEAAQPSERDESTDPADHGGRETKGPRQLIEQAARDISRGLRDTDLHGTPSNVPGPGLAPEQSPGAEVPEEGVTDPREHSHKR